MKTLANITTTDLQQLASYVFPTINWSLFQKSDFIVDESRLPIIVRRFSKNHKTIETLDLNCKSIVSFSLIGYVIKFNVNYIYHQPLANYHSITIDIQQRQDIQYFIKTQLTC
jgi:hypothetical protein